MLRKIVQIDEEKCNGCGVCISGCHEGALKIIDGKAKLISDSYCDGLGACLPACPQNAIAIVEREAESFDEEAVKGHLAGRGKAVHTPSAPRPGGCPGSMVRMIEREWPADDVRYDVSPQKSELRQWPCQLQLVPVNAPYFKQAHLLIAADCAAYACADLHAKFMRNKITLIGCPKLDDAAYAEKLAKILEVNEIKSITVVRMEVPCCGGLVHAVKEALVKSGKLIPWSVTVIGIDGNIRED
jgi:NAD-dependent dihydropyrimidine dehydrogenase PreA subunit